jgi:hypothetical protein
MAKRIEIWPIDRLVPYEKNARTHSDAQVIQIAASIVEFGFTNPILVDTNAGIIAGHGRLLAARKLGLAEVPVIILDHLSEAQKRAYVIADNKLALNAGWDDALLSAELAELQRDGFDLGLTGFSEAELEDLLSDGTGLQGLPEPQIDNAAELQKKWGTERGQLWLIGKHRLLCGDSTSEDDVRRLMNGQRASLFATDPPYLVAYDGTNHPHKWNDSEEIKRRKNKDWSDKYTDVDSPEMGEKLYDAFVGLAVDVAITENAAWYCWHASRKQALLEAVWEKHGPSFTSRLFGRKTGPS